MSDTANVVKRPRRVIGTDQILVMFPKSGGQIPVRMSGECWKRELIPRLIELTGFYPSDNVGLPRDLDLGEPGQEVDRVWVEPEGRDMRFRFPGFDLLVGFRTARHWAEGMILASMPDGEWIDTPHGRVREFEYDDEILLVRSSLMKNNQKSNEKLNRI